MLTKTKNIIVFLWLTSISGIRSFLVSNSLHCLERIQSTRHWSNRETKASNYASEDILLRVKLSINTGKTTEEAKQRISKYSQSFPFSAVLPVQPLMYLPTDDDGVEVRFLRKKTDIKSGIEGGIRFFIEETEDNCLEITARRNSEGQTIPKMFAERLVVTSFVKGIKGEEGGKFGEAPTDTVGIHSIFHKWMDNEI